jgi:hypothetical protein
MGSVSDFSELDRKTAVMEQLGFEVKGEFGIPNRRYFVLCDQKTNLRFIHLHIFLDNSLEVSRHLQFRDFLRRQKDLTNKYGQLKKEIVNDLSRKNYYQEEKSQLVSEIEAMAIKEKLPQRTLIINGAAKGGHNTEHFIKALYNSSEAKWIDLNALEFPTFEYVKNPDDSFISLIKEIIDHDVIILGAPVYWYSLPSSIKIFLDRLSNLMSGPYKEFGEKLYGKKLIVCSTGYEDNLPVGFEVPFIGTSIYFGIDYLGIKYKTIKG